MRNHTAGLEEEEERCRQCRPLLTPFIRTPLRLRSRPDGRSDTPTGNPTSRALAQIYIQQLPWYHWLMIGNGKLSFVLKPTFVKLLQSWINLTNSLTHEPTWHDGQFPSHEVQQNCKLCPRLNHNLWRAYDCLKSSHKLSTGCTLTDLTAFGQHWLMLMNNPDESGASSRKKPLTWPQPQSSFTRWSLKITAEPY